VRSATAGDDAAVIAKASDELQRASHAMAETLYKAQAQQGAGTEPQPADADVVDAELVDK
jgi:hypothetical protein